MQLESCILMGETGGGRVEGGEKRDAEREGENVGGGIEIWWLRRESDGVKCISEDGGDS